MINFYDFFTKVFGYFKKRHLLCEASRFYLIKEILCREIDLAIKPGSIVKRLLRKSLI